MVLHCRPGMHLGPKIDNICIDQELLLKKVTAHTMRTKNVKVATRQAAVFKQYSTCHQGLEKRAILCFRNPNFYFGHGESTSTASQLTTPASQKK